MAKEYGLLMYMPSSGEWIMEGEHHRGSQSEKGESSWAWWQRTIYTSATAALQVLNNVDGWEVEAVWTEAVGYQDAKLDHPMPVYLLSHPAEHVYRPDSTSPKPSVKIW